MRDVGSLWIFMLDQKSDFAHIQRATFAMSKTRTLIGGHVGIKRTCHVKHCNKEMMEPEKL